MIFKVCAYFAKLISKMYATRWNMNKTNYAIYRINFISRFSLCVFVLFLVCVFVFLHPWFIFFYSLAFHSILFLWWFVDNKKWFYDHWDLLRWFSFISIDKFKKNDSIFAYSFNELLSKIIFPRTMHKRNKRPHLLITNKSV